MGSAVRSDERCDGRARQRAPTSLVCEGTAFSVSCFRNSGFWVRLHFIDIERSGGVGFLIVIGSVGVCYFHSRLS